MVFYPQYIAQQIYIISGDMEKPFSSRKLVFFFILLFKLCVAALQKLQEKKSPFMKNNTLYKIQLLKHWQLRGSIPRLKSYTEFNGPFSNQKYAML